VKPLSRDILARLTIAVCGRSNANCDGPTGSIDGCYAGGLPRFSVDGLFEGYIVSASDITDLKSAQEASVARQKLESLGVLAGGIAHDFNNLLGAIHATAELAEELMTDGSPGREEVHSIQAISMRASGIVHQLMIYAGEKNSDLEFLDLSQLVREMLDFINISISKSAILRTSLEKDLPAVLGNRSQIQQVMMNLILNASDSLGDRGGTISVTTSVGRTIGIPAFSSSVGLPQGAHVILEVSDTGSGITKEVQARIFDPFFTTKVAGRGLGLAVVQGVVHAHKGSIELTSAPDKGTTFRVLWPIATQSPQSAFGVKRAAARHISMTNTHLTGNVLVVEDEEPLRLSIAKMLRKQGLFVIEAADGATAVNLFRNHQNKIDVVLLDVTLPGPPSSTVVAEAGHLRPGTKVLLMSAYSRETVGAVAAVPEVSGFIRKPFQLGDLVAVIRETLSA
jgi:nitrogen-specific signal transduction histidine kinase/ActR/RegA family two-component response regulator